MALDYARRVEGASPLSRHFVLPDAGPKQQPLFGRAEAVFGGQSIASGNAADQSGAQSTALTKKNARWGYQAPCLVVGAHCRGPSPPVGSLWYY